MQDRSYNLNLITNTTNDNEFIRQILSLFEEQSLINLQQLEVSCKNSDWETVFFIAHKLKSSLVLFQIDPAIEAIKFIEFHAKQRSQPLKIAERIAELETIVHNVIRQMKSDHQL